MTNLIIFGAPGSGKGTQSERIAEKYKLDHISTGDIFRQEIAQGTELGIIADKYISQGQLVPDAHVIAILEDYIEKRHKAVNGFIFDGFPRTIAQAKSLENMLASHSYAIQLVLNLDVPEEELITRLLNRGKNSGRADDNRITIEKRLIEYHQKTEPLIAFFRQQNLLADIKGFGSVDEIFSQICTEIECLEQS